MKRCKIGIDKDIMWNILDMDKNSLLHLGYCEVDKLVLDEM